MSATIYIASQRFDLDPKVTVSIVRQINDVAEQKDRQSVYAPTIKGLFSENNHALMDYAYRAQSVSDKKHNRITDVILEIDGTQYTGYLVLQNVTDAYNMAFYSGNAEFFRLIEGLKLEDLDLTGYDRNWNFTDMTAAWGGSDPAFTHFFAVENGDLPVSTRTIDIRKQYYSLYISALFEKIITEAGFTFTGGMFDDTKYIKSVLPFTNEYPRKDAAWATAYNVKAFRTTDQILPTNGQYIKILFDDDFSLGYDGNAIYNPATGRLTATKAMKANITAFLHYQTVSALAYPYQYDVRAILLKNGTTTVGFSTSGSLYSSLTKDLTIKGSPDLLPGEYLEVYAWLRRGPLNTGDSLTIKSTSYVQYDFTGDDILLWGEAWKWKLNLPDISQKDFIKAIMQMTCAMVDTDGFKKELRFEKFELLEYNKRNAIPIDRYIDHKQVPDENYTPSSYAQKNWFRYKEDENVLAEYGDGYFTIDKNVLDAEKEIVKLPFAASTQTTKLSGLSVWEVLRIKDGNDVTPEPRIMLQGLVDGLTGGDVITLTDGTSNYTSGNFWYLYFNDETATDSLGFDYLLRDNYDDLIRSLNDYFRLNIKLLFSPNFINQLDHFIPVYSDIYNCYFYINKTQYVSESHSPTELIRLS